MTGELPERQGECMGMEALSCIFAGQDWKRSLKDGEAEALSESLVPRNPKSHVALARLAFQGFYGTAPMQVRLAALKIIRFILRPGKAVNLKMPSECLFNRKVAELDSLGFKRREYKRRNTVCLSYDIDRAGCHVAMPQVAETLSKRGFKATFNILAAWEYKPDWDMMRGLKDSGFEIGLHGGAHDTALGYRGKSTICWTLKDALDRIPFEVSGFRAPALCMTPLLMESLAEAGFIYDSSLPAHLPRCANVGTSFPYRLPQGIVELPPALQDSTLFLDLKLSDGDSLRRCCATVEEILALGGLPTLILHPYILAGRDAFHNGLLDWLESKGCECVTMKEAADGDGV